MAFLVAKKLIKEGEVFFSSSPHPNAPLFITAWIMDTYVYRGCQQQPELDSGLPLLDRCDEIGLDGTMKPSSMIRMTYGHAQKMRAAMTYAFGRLFGLGTLPWHKSETTGQMMGNPSVSDTVSSYMVSLRRRKVHLGEAATSARAITPVDFSINACTCPGGFAHHVSHRIYC